MRDIGLQEEGRCEGFLGLRIGTMIECSQDGGRSDEAQMPFRRVKRT